MQTFLSECHQKKVSIRENIVKSLNICYDLDVINHCYINYPFINLFI